MVDYLLPAGICAGLAIFLALGGGGIFRQWGLEPIGIGVPLLAAAIVLMAPQMADMFAAMRTGWDAGGYNHDAWHQIGFSVGVLFLGVQSWFWMRAALNVRRGCLDKDVPPGVDWKEDWAPRLTMVPIVLIALAPVFLWAWGRWIGKGRIPSDSVPWFGVVGALVACWIIWTLTWLRRRHLQTMLAARKGARQSKLPKTRTAALFAAAPGGQWCAMGVLAVAVVMVTVDHAAPDWVNERLHTPTSAFLALGCLVAMASVILALLRDLSELLLRAIRCLVNLVRRQPLKADKDISIAANAIGLIVLIIAPFLASSFWQDRGLFDVDIFKDSTLAPRVDIRGATDNYLECLGKPSGEVPAIIVALEGGASRSAAWSLSVMRMLDSRTDGVFGSHLFAITSVSGGSLAAVTYSLAQAKYLEDHKKAPANQAEREAAQRDFWKADGPMSKGLIDLAQADLLSSSIARLFTTDMLFGIPRRGVSLTGAFEQMWHHKHSFNLDKLAGAKFLGLRGKSSCMPQLLLNGTDVASGNRIITSTIQFETTEPAPFAAATDALFYLGGDISAADAVLNSARFPIISPPGRLSFDKDRDSMVIDGGVFENYGARTAWELARAIEKGGSNLQPIIVVISNDVDADPKMLLPGVCPNGSLTDRLNALAQAASLKNARGGVVPDALTSVLGLFNTRQAHALGELETVKSLLCSSPPVKSHLFQINLPAPDVTKGQAAPMNWVLDEYACRFMLGAGRIEKVNSDQAAALRDVLGVSASRDGGAQEKDADACGVQPSKSTAK